MSEVLKRIENILLTERSVIGLNPTFLSPDANNQEKRLLEPLSEAPEILMDQSDYTLNSTEGKNETTLDKR